MLNLDTPVELTKEQKDIIKSFGILSVDDWKKNETKLRKKIASDLCALQDGLCVYCGCKVYGPGDVEHIANKAKYTEFMFTPLNLAYACKTCNEIYKGSADVIKIKKPDYDKCEFNIVHPYLDDVDHFFDTKGAVIQIRESLNKVEMQKARQTYELLHWSFPAVYEKRAERIAALSKAKDLGKTISQIAIDNILTFIP